MFHILFFFIVVSVFLFSSMYFSSVSTTPSIYINSNLNSQSNNSLDLVLVPSSSIENPNPFFDMILGMSSEPSIPIKSISLDTLLRVDLLVQIPFNHPNRDAVIEFALRPFT